MRNVYVHTRLNYCTWVVCVYNPEDGLQSGAMAIQSFQQTLVNVLEEKKKTELFVVCWFLTRFRCDLYQEFP